MRSEHKNPNNAVERGAEHISIDGRWSQHLQNALSQNLQASRINARKFISDTLDRHETPTETYTKTWQTVIGDVTAITSKARLTSSDAENSLLQEAGYSWETIERFRSTS